MEKSMKTNFEFLKERVVDSLDNTDLDYIRNQLSQLDEPTIFSGADDLIAVAGVNVALVGRLGFGQSTVCRHPIVVFHG